MDPHQLYLDLYKEYRTEMRHQETQRAAVSGTSVALAGAIIGLAFHDGTNAARPYFGLLLVNFSLGSIFALRKLYERFTLARERAMAFLDAVDTAAKLKGEDRLLAVWLKGRDCNEAKQAFFSFVRLHWLWESLLLGTFVVGVAFVLKACVGTGPCFGLWNTRAMPERTRWLLCLLIAGPVLQWVVLLAARWRERKEKLAERAAKREERAAQAATSFQMATNEEMTVVAEYQVGDTGVEGS